MNAKNELIRKTEWKTIERALLSIEWEYDYEKNEDTYKKYILKKWYTQKDMDLFLDSIDFEYDSWYWGQELFWEVVFNDWTRLDRWEYDWSGWWNYNKLPETPEECL